MEAAEETLTYRDDTLLHRTLLQEDNKHKDKQAETRSDESNYVDLDMKPDGASTVEVTSTGQENQPPVTKCDSSTQAERGEEGKTTEEDCVEGERVSGESPLETRSKLPNAGQHHARSDSDELQYTDMYLNSKTESDDGASAVMSDHCGSDTVEDESHYITTHEIQLTELDHDVDYDLGRGTCWDFEDDNLVFSFVDYASFEGDDTQEGTLILRGRGQGRGQGRGREKAQSNLGGDVVSTEQEDSDPCDSDKCGSSDESVCKNHTGGDTNAGEIHVSIKTSRARNEQVSVSDNSTSGYTKRFGDGSHFSFVSSGARVGPFSDRAQYFIPAPGRQHLASKLRRKDINEYSSGASSSISELDDADKEVRNLTAKSFRSLACPYFDAINLSTSSESSVSEYGLNNWSAYVDLKYGNISRGGERSVIETSSTTLEMNKTVDSKRHGKSAPGMKAPQTRMYALNKRTTSQQSSSSSKKMEMSDAEKPKQRGVTLNFRCKVEAPEGAKRPKCSKKARSNELTGTVLAKSGCEVQCVHSESTGGTHKRAVFASSLLKNVISKKMQFEQERKMERGERCDAYPALSPSFQLKDHDGVKDRGQGRGLQRQTSESGSGFTVNSADDQYLDGSRPSSCEPVEEQNSDKALVDSEKGKHEPLKASLSHSQSSAFNLLKADEPEPVKEIEPTSVSDTRTTTKGLDTSNMLTKLVFVPSCQLLSKEKDVTEDLPVHAPVTGAPVGPQKCEKEFQTGNNGNIGKEENEKGGKTPGIKICLRSVKENKGCTLNIANLLTPKISLNNVNTFRAAGDAKCNMLSASDKIPNFTVRDIRDTKCKFQTPIYQVRDVRKLVKSSYRFVSLDNSEAKCSTAAEKLEVTKAPVKHVLPSPIVIKCHSVKTNVKQETAEAGISSEAVKTSANTPSQCTASRVPLVASKQLHPDQSDIQPNIETKLTKQRQEKFACETSERRNEPKIPKQAALEKLKAAVKTMEQLYVYDRNEWKRKSQAPQPITDSHVLSLIASEEQGAEELETTNTDRVTQSQEAKGALNIIHVPYNDDTFQTQSHQSKTFSNKRVLHFGNKARVSISSVSDPIPQNSELQTSSTMKSSGAPVAPLSVKIEPPKKGRVDQGKVKIIPTNPTVAQACSDSENYLAIPGYTNEIQLLNPDPVSREVSSSVSRIKTVDRKTPEQNRSPLIMDYPASSIYHQAQQQVLCFSPSVHTVSPTPSTGEAVPQTQRKMLLDPTTGHYYLVDTPIQATTKRLFDPETGQYVDVPMSPSPVASVTPVPLSLSPLAISPGAYAPTYMIYPGFIPSPTLPAQAVLPQSPCHSEYAGGEKVKKARSPKPDTSSTGTENAYYSATVESTQGPLQLPVSLGHVTARGGAASSDRKPVISITTQQGPRIIAPPSFDGTTMSFVVEHR
ncbi:uncharacterized protein C4orf54 homolog [Anoplopoma fimbria]|uniref:uncharacterized protein C4orf54 homolog n=1 Tax=Anoplopoma fimbria TaxID=229290 RepID=UPI0023EA9D01|nr:uncharacterized protein C4orf54 homolog [Anoplopoma fimbria]